MQRVDRWEETFSIASYEVDFTGVLSLFSLFNRFQNIAGIHAEHLEVGYRLLRQSNLAWILSRIKLNIVLMPKWGETVRLATWPKGIDRLFALREFRMTDSAGKSLVEATTSWLLIDVERGRPRRIESLPIDLHFPSAEQAIHETPAKLTAPGKLIPVLEKIIVPSDLDINLHVNNAQYAKWISDSFEPEWLRARIMKSIQINYLDETRLGETVIVMKAEDDPATETFLEGRSKAKDAIVFQAYVCWSFSPDHSGTAGRSF